MTNLNAVAIHLEDAGFTIKIITRILGVYLRKPLIAISRDGHEVSQAEVRHILNQMEGIKNIKFNIDSGGGDVFVKVSN